MITIDEVKKAITEYVGDTDGSSLYYTDYLNLLQLYKDLAEVQDAEIARLRQQLEWQPIETAPKDGTVIELNGPSFEYLVIGKWVDFGSYVFRGVRESGESKWVNMGLAFPKIKNPTLWRPIPPLPQAKEGSPMDNPLTDEGSHE